MNINRKNYEVWMIDYFDGKLNAAETARLMEFLDANPDLKGEFDLFENVPLEVEGIQFEKKSALKKPAIHPIGEINEENYEEYLIAYYENDLTGLQKEKLDEFLEKNPRLKKEFTLHASLILPVDNAVFYGQKENLKKTRRVGAYWWTVAAAALILLLFGIYSLFENTTQVPAARQEIFVLNTVEKQNLVTITQISKPGIKPELRTTPGLAISGVEELIVSNEPEHFTIVKLDPVTSKLSVQTANESPIITPGFIEPEEILAFADITGEEKNKSLLGKIIRNFASRLKDETPEILQKTNKSDPGFVKILDQGITVFNTITGSDTELVKSYDNKGNLTHYQVDGQSLSWSRKVDTPPAE